MRLNLLLLVLTLTCSVSAQSPDSLLLVRTDTLYFDFGRAELRSEADTLLRQFAADWQPEYRVYLTGHTDAVGADRANDQLARRRARVAREVLLAAGLPEDALIIETFGERAPVAPNEADDDRQRNRRVTIDLLRPRPSCRAAGRITGRDSNGLKAKVLFSGKTFRDSVETDADGRYTIGLPADEVVSMEVYAPDYFFSARMFKVECGRPLPLDAQLQPADAGEVADIPDLFFYGDQDVLLPNSAGALPRVLRFLQINPRLKVEIAGHINYPNTPPLPESSTDHQLSIRRARRVYDYLIENGIAPERLKYHGYGNSQMRFPQARSERDQAANRRVEIRVLED